MRVINLLILLAGIFLAAYGHVRYAVFREAPVQKAAVDLMYIIPGWALITMGYVGLQRQRPGALSESQ